MKDYYKISEISKLYDIGADSLRYYERAGIITPKRGENGYRLYSLKDIYKLSVLRDLMELGFSVAQAKEYLDGQNIGKTLALLQRESNMLSERLQELKQKKELIEERIAVLSAARTIKAGEATVKNLPERSCVRISERITRDEEMDFVIKKLHMEHADKIRDLGNQTIGAFFSAEALAAGARTSTTQSSSLSIGRATAVLRCQRGNISRTSTAAATRRTPRACGNWRITRRRTGLPPPESRSSCTK